MKVKAFLLFLLTAMVMMACNSKKVDDEKPVSSRLPGDKTVYGLACDGCNDSVVVLLPEDGSDPVTYNIIDAKRNGRVLGKLQIGDRIGIMVNKRDKRVADEVVDIDRLQAVWCYIVMPKMRDFEHMSKRLQARLMNNMSDSLKETFLIPREYGFWLKPEWEAQSVGYVAETNSLADESPVVYPPLGYFTKWHIWNGKFIMVSGTPKLSKDNQLEVINLKYDTCSIDYLDTDSLVLTDADGSRSYYRKDNIDDANKKAREIAEKRSKEALQQTKDGQ